MPDEKKIQMRSGRDFRVWSLPKADQKVPTEIVKQGFGTTYTTSLEGGSEAAELIVKIVNDAYGEELVSFTESEGQFVFTIK